MASVIVVVIIFVLLALAILFICQNGGWQGGCGATAPAATINAPRARRKRSNALVKAFPAGKAFFKWLCFARPFFLLPRLHNPLKPGILLISILFWGRFCP